MKASLPAAEPESRSESSPDVTPHLSQKPGPSAPILVIAGPTAVGKTALSIEVARAIGAEVVSADSRQIYREMSVGTAKPSVEELATVTHHFVDELSLDEHFSAGIFRSDATSRIEKITGRGHRALVVGGSTLYIHALIFGLADIPDVDPEIAEELKADLDKLGSARMHAELRRLDPSEADRIDPTKSHRIVRALAVLRTTGRSLASYFSDADPDPRFRLVVLSRARSDLYERINSRVDDMIERGLRQEVEEIVQAGYDSRTPALRTIGYREMIRHFDGESLPETIRLIKRNSRRYAKRQLTWFRRYGHATWLDANAPLEHLTASALDVLGT